MRERECECRCVRVSSFPPRRSSADRAASRRLSIRTPPNQKYLRTRGPCPPYPGLDVGDEEDAPGAAGGGGLSADDIQVFLRFDDCACPCASLPLLSCFRGPRTFISGIEVRANPGRRVFADNVHQQHVIAVECLPSAFSRTNARSTAYYSRITGECEFLSWTTP